MHSNVTIKSVSWPHFSWTTLYASDDDGDIDMYFAALHCLKVFDSVMRCQCWYAVDILGLHQHIG